MSAAVFQRFNMVVNGDGYHLSSRSAAIDRGLDAEVTVDIDGQSRDQNAPPDLGADEYVTWRATYLPVVMNGRDSVSRFAYLPP